MKTSRSDIAPTAMLRPAESQAGEGALQGIPEIAIRFRKLREKGGRMPVTFRVEVAEYIQAARSAGALWRTLAADFGVSPQALRKLQRRPERTIRQPKPKCHWTSVVRERLSYDPETGIFTFLAGHRKGQEAGSTRHNNGVDYRSLSIEGRPFPAHVVAWFLQTGELPGPGVKIDHRDRNGLNNRFANLRLCDGSENALNARPKTLPNKHSKFKGVCRLENGWIANLRVAGVVRGRRAKTEIEAARLYDELATTYAGEFACTNVMLGLLPPLETTGAA